MRRSGGGIRTSVNRDVAARIHRLHPWQRGRWQGQVDRSAIRGPVAEWKKPPSFAVPAVNAERVPFRVAGILKFIWLLCKTYAYSLAYQCAPCPGKARPMTTHLDLLRTIVTHTVHEAPPGEFLVGEKADRWARAFAFSRVKASGERVGVRRDGVLAAMRLARSLASDKPQYHRGARYKTLAEAILDVSMEKFNSRPPDSIVASDLAALKSSVQEWFSRNNISRTYIVPCSIIPDLNGFPNAKPFAIGPATFRHVSEFLKASTSSDLTEKMLEEMSIGPLLQAMNERHATWLAEVTIDGCEETKASEIADLAVDIALVGIQLVIPAFLSRNMARITGRTSPPFVGSMYRTGSQTHGGIHWRQPGQGLSGGAFDEVCSMEVDVLQSVGRRVQGYVRGGPRLPNLEQAWCDAAYWFHEGLAESLDSIAVAKHETAIEVLLGAESSSRSEKRLCEALHAFHGVSEDDPIATDPSVTIKQYAKGIVGPRSRFLHGTWSTLGENAEAARANVEALSRGLLRLSSLALDRYCSVQSPTDNTASFLEWINSERENSGTRIS